MDDGATRLAVFLVGDLMRNLADRVIPRDVEIPASAVFTRDMAANLALIFQELSDGSRVVVSFTSAGVWVELDNSARLFIGATEAFKFGCRYDEHRQTQ